MNRTTRRNHQPNNQASRRRKKHRSGFADYPILRIIIGFPLLFMTTTSTLGVVQDLYYIMNSGAMIGDIDEMRLFLNRFLNIYMWSVPISIALFFIILKYELKQIEDYVVVFVMSIVIYIVLVLLFSFSMNWESLEMTQKFDFVLSFIVMTILVGILSVIIAYFLLPQNFKNNKSNKRIENI